MKPALLISALTLLFVTMPLAAQGGDITQEGSGIGANKQEALMAAKRDAIEKGIGMILLSQTEIENFMVKRDQIITKTMGAVKSYEVLKEGTAADGSYEITIKAVLSRQAMRDDLAAFHILIESMGKPRVMVIISENNVGNEEPANNATETALISMLRDPYEFDIVDPSVTADIRRSQQKMAALAGDAQAAAAIGAQYGAEVVITGTAISRKATDAVNANLGGMVSVQADITLKAVNCTNARIFATGTGHGAAVHVSPNTAGNKAFEKAATTALMGSKKKGSKPGLLDAIIKEWQNQLNNGITIKVAVQNVTTFRIKNNVMHTLNSIGGISAARERGWNGTSKVLDVDIQYKGNVDGFCTKLDGYKLKSGAGSMAVTGVSGNAVTLMMQAM